MWKGRGRPVLGGHQEGTVNNGMVVMQISATGSTDKEFLEVESHPSLPLTERRTPLQMEISLIHVHVSYEGEPILPGQVLPL